MKFLTFCENNRTFCENNRTFCEDNRTLSRNNYVSSEDNPTLSRNNYVLSESNLIFYEEIENKKNKNEILFPYFTISYLLCGATKTDRGNVKNIV